MVIALPRQGDFYKFCFAHCTHKPNLNFKTFVIFEYLQLCYQNAAIEPQNLDFKQNVEELEEGPL